MKSLYKGILLGALQCGLVLSLAGKLIYDRATCPHVWVRTMPYDPMLPIRGRYLSLALAPDAGASSTSSPKARLKSIPAAPVRTPTNSGPK